MTKENLSIPEKSQTSTITTPGNDQKDFTLAQEHFVQILEGCADAVVVSDKQGKILFFNQMAERQFQYHRSEMIGKNVRLLMPQMHAVQHDTYMNNYLTTRQAKVIGIGRELDALRKDQSLFPIILTISESKLDGETFFTAFIKDNTEKKKLEEQVRKQLEEVQASEEELRQNMEELQTTQEKQEKLTQDLKESEAEIKSQINAINTAYSFITFSPEGILLDANDMFLKTMGYQSIDEIRGKHHQIFVDSAYAQTSEYRQFWQDLRNGINLPAVYQRFDKNREEVWLDAVYAPVLDENNKTVKIIKLAKDVTDFTIGLKASGAFLEELRKGNFEVELDLGRRLASEDLAGMIKNNLALRDTLKDILKDVNRVVNIAGQEGVLAERLKTEHQMGAWRNLTESLNHLLNNIYTPLIEINRLITNLSMGNITEKFELKAQGDIGDMANALNIAFKNLNTLLLTIEDSAFSVAGASSQMKNKSLAMRQTTQEASIAIQEMADGAQEQANRTDEASRLVEDTLKSAGEVSQKAEIINQAAKKGQINCQSGLTTVSSLVQNMSKLSESAQITAQAIEILTDRSDEISRTLNVITDIAFQTKLLSVNAAIEAARAGESGRGFQVVADEIGKLAESSRTSATDIDRVIKDVQKDIQKTNQAIEQMKKGVIEGHQATEKVSLVFSEIDTSSQETLTLSEAILIASQTQKESIDAVVKNIEKIVVVSEQTASGTQEVANSSLEMDKAMSEVTNTSEELTQISEGLKNQVGKFKLNRG